MDNIDLLTIPTDSGIYRFTNITTGKFYIGSALNLRKRFIQHRSNLKLGIHHSPHFQNAYNKYGSSDFKYDILEMVPDVTQLLLREQHYLDTLLFAQEYISKISNKFLELGYNINPFASSRFGSKQSLEAITASILHNKRIYPVLQFNFNGEFIKEFISSGQAANELNLSRSCIWNCCCGNQEYCNNYFFIFKKDLNTYTEYFNSLKENPFIPTIWNKNKHYQLNKEFCFVVFDRYGRYINRYTHLNEISKLIKSDIANISSHKNIKLIKNYYVFDIEYDYNSFIDNIKNKYQFINNCNQFGNILIYDVFDNLIGAFNSVEEASKTTNINSNSIYNVLCGKRFQIKGFKFKYRDDIV